MGILGQLGHSSGQKHDRGRFGTGTLEALNPKLTKATRQMLSRTSQST